MIDDMAAITISEEEAARDFAGLMARVRAGEEVVIAGSSDAVVMRKQTTSKDPSIEATLKRLAESRASLGYTPVMGEDFASDLEEIVGRRSPADRSAWE